MSKNNIEQLSIGEKIKLLPEKDQWYLNGYVDKALKLLISSSSKQYLPNTIIKSHVKPT